MGRALILMLLCAAGGPARAQEQLESEVKAAFLSKFGDYVEWPTPPGANFTVCTVGTDAVVSALDDIVKGQRIADRLVVVTHLNRIPDTVGCQIIYLAQSAASDAAAVLKFGIAAHALTVTDRASGDGKGIVNFVLRDRRVRFEIDDQAAEASGLKISSQLMKLAVSIRSRNEGTRQ